MIITRSATTKKMITAQSLQFLFLASLSTALAVFFMLNAVSLILELFDTISYTLSKVK
jgi:hypothetical protein